MITYLLPAILFVQFVIFAGVLLFCMRERDIRTKSGIYLFIAYVMALFTLAGIFVVVYFPFPIQQEEIALNIEYELGQTNTVLMNCDSVHRYALLCICLSSFDFCIPESLSLLFPPL